MNWCFFEQQKINFSSGSAIVADSSALTGWGEGCASISDKNSGELLFYTDGLTVFNRHHVVMQNGENLSGAISSTQSALIIPMPCDSSRYYLFTTMDFAIQGVSYSIIDMRLNGGLGAVTSVKNVSINENAAEKMAGTIHSNGIDYWVITTDKWNNGFNAFKVTASGVMPAITSNVGLTNYFPRAAGQMKISPDGAKIAKAYYNESGNPSNLALGETFHFDNSTGQVSDPIQLHFTGFDRAYGTEFSPNSNLVYFEVDQFYTPTAHNFLFQFDLSTYDSIYINNSRRLIDSTSTRLSNLQLGADGKIYTPRLFNLAVISNPNQVGSLCNYIVTGLVMPHHNGGWISDGLPNFVSSFFNPNAPHAACTTVPLKLVKFNGRLKQDHIELVWETQNEINMDHFIIERSTSGISFKSFREIKASPANQNLYTVIDPDYFNGVNYYRLKMVDQDDNFTYSNIISVKASRQFAASIFPNPVNTILNIKITNSILANLSIKILDISGKTLIEKHFLQEGTDISLPLEGLSPGTYILSITRLDERRYLKFIKI